MQEFYEANKTDQSVLDGRLRSILDIVVRLRPASVLDIACGRGTLLAALANRLPGAHICGLEISESSARVARGSGFDVRAGDVTEGIPFGDDFFDAVVFGEIIEHLVDPDRALVSIARSLKVGGTLILSTPNLASWLNRAFLLFGIQPLFTETSLHANLGRRLRLFGQYGKTQGHLKIFTLGALKEMLAANGFDVVEVRGASFPTESPLGLVDRIFTRIPPLASGFVVVARNRGTRTTAYPRP